MTQVVRDDLGATIFRVLQLSHFTAAWLMWTQRISLFGFHLHLQIHAVAYERVRHCRSDWFRNQAAHTHDYPSSQTLIWHQICLVTFHFLFDEQVWCGRMISLCIPIFIQLRIYSLHIVTDRVITHLLLRLADSRSFLIWMVRITTATFQVSTLNLIPHWLFQGLTFGVFLSHDSLVSLRGV